VTSTFDAPAARAHRIQDLARITEYLAIALAVVSLVGAVLLATRRVRRAGCFQTEQIGNLGQDLCSHRSGVLLAVAVGGELAVLFALFLVVFAARYAAFRAEVFLVALAERGAVAPSG
jgi:hypothetical protein